MVQQVSLKKAIETLKQGGIIAYPTEAVFGLGCDPLNEQTTLRLLKLKNRSISKGLILIAADWEQLQPYIRPIDPIKMANILANWPTPMTWVFPATEAVPSWIKGSHDSIAVRVTAHPTARTLCEIFAAPIVSTSANAEGQNPARSAEEIRSLFPNGIDYIVEGQCGDLSKPTEIRDAVSGQVLRQG